MKLAVSETTLYRSGAVRGYTIAVHQRCVVDPVSPRRNQNRGRVCVVESISSGILAGVRFEDDQENGAVLVEDLVPVGVESTNENPDARASGV